MRNESGAILLITAFIAVVLVIFLALVIDVSLMFVTQDQLQRVIDHATMGGLKSFLDQNTLNLRPASARDRAKEIFESRHNRLFAQALFKNPGSLQSDIQYAGGGGGGSNGKIYFGRWHSAEPPNGCTGYLSEDAQCPCVGGAYVNKKCFENRTAKAVAGATDANIDAIKIEYHLASANPFQTIFARVVGLNELVTGVTSIAAITPRHGYAEIDGSVSITQENFRAIGATGGYEYPNGNYHRAEAKYAFGLQPGQDCASNPAIVTSCISNPDTCPLDNNDDLRIQWTDSTSIGNLPGIRNCFPPYSQTGDPACFAGHQIRHYRDDYQCVEAKRKDTSGNVIARDYSLVANYRETGANGVHIGPQPYTRVLKTVNLFAQRFRDRKQTGDLFGMSFFDHEPNFIPNRQFRLEVPSDSNSEFINLLKVTDVSFDTWTTGVTWQQRLKYRNEERYYIPRTNAYTDILLALQQASSALAAERTGQVDSFIILFTDGLTNCITQGSNRACQNTEQYHRASMSEVVNFAINSLAPSRVALHTMLIGEDVGGHTLVRDDGASAGDGDCLNEAQTRNLGRGALTDYRTGPSYGGGNWGQTKYFYPNRLSEASVVTKGLYLPLRPPLLDNLGNPINLSSWITQKCKDSTVSRGNIVNCSGGDCTYNTGTTNPVVLDKFGRLLYDPYGRTYDEQAQAFVDAIFTKSTFAIVDN
ncbi:VWA domain-containing protein [bacterium]|nr:VWA domain-containing protein [bacterium]